MATSITPASLSSGPSTADRVALAQAAMAQMAAPMRDDAVVASQSSSAAPVEPRINTADLQSNHQANAVLNTPKAPANHSPVNANTFLLGVTNSPSNVSGA
jgi:hypothetical protein